LKEQHEELWASLRRREREQWLFAYCLEFGEHVQARVLTVPCTACSETGAIPDGDYLRRCEDCWGEGRIRVVEYDEERAR
jgi:hypothetical protein